MRQSDIPTSSPSPQASPSAAATVLAAVRFVSRPSGRRSHWRPGPWSPGCPPRALQNGDAGTSRVPAEPVCARAVVLDPGGSRVPHHNGTYDAAFGHQQSLDSHNLENFGAAYLRPVRSLSTLRSHGCPCTTQDSLAARRLRFDRMGLPPIRLACPVSEACTSFPGRRLFPAHADFSDTHPSPASSRPKMAAMIVATTPLVPTTPSAAARSLRTAAA
jgi:hypothetical protein